MPILPSDGTPLPEPWTPTDGIFTIDLESMNKIGLAVLTKAGVPIEVGASLRFQVRGNPTTGFEWIVNDEAALGLFTIENLYVPDPAPAGWTGVGGVYYFTIKAGSDVGKGSFKIEYKQPWDSENESPLQSYTIPVQVVNNATQ